MTNWSAQASAAAAVSHQEGCHPISYASRSPCVLTTAIPKPAHLSAFHLPSSSEPSQSKWRRAVWGHRRAGDVPSCVNGATWTLTARSPCSVRCLRLCSDSLDHTRPASGGRLGHPSEGRVFGQQNLCSLVPIASKQSWHLLSVTPKAGTSAFLAWGLSPPQTAEARSLLHLVFHKSRTCPALLGQGLPLSMRWCRKCTAPKQS